MAISSIDDLLMGGSAPQHPMPTEEKFQDEPDPVEELEDETPEYDDAPEDDHTNDSDADEDETEEPEDDHPKEFDEDEYGNKKERMSKGMKDRLDRKEKQYQREVEERDRQIQDLRSQLANQGASREVQQAAKDFEYDPDAAGNWQQQLASFVKQTVNSMTRETQEAETRQRDAEAQQQFETKFRDGMSRFDDFREVIGSLPCEITNPMTLATRAMDNPAAFLYAAAKRHPTELERISKIRDPYGQMMEMGKLEERMRKNKPTTKAPRPLGRTQEDATTKSKPKERDTSGDDLLAKADAKRLTSVKQRLKGNR
ncbi:hypothetical protein UFOVP685_20 [uncultured Caudovirales phage]|uniref:Scaffolding protein n=1 Tax=uncultured Caudovirales phage TaxID=2100421 RepID=A0A6J7X4B0_9CAUD|nr:hypothetical protein UFOVP590_3 [uncultured Caudovirales phage]CAB4157379.1 hypothetical protein UFOVP685_20 [uncultured Caudovirales phage]CAB5225456.1 hypothetical protein UFOVP750_32 [uncultured Caudovirales phage]